MKNKSLLYSFFIVVFGLLCFVPFLGHVHLFDWDEINFAECAREMIVSKNYSTVQIDFHPFWEKPPLFIWMQAVSMKIFGINEFAARFPNAVGGVVTLLVVYLLGKRIYDEKFGRIWVLVFAGSLLPNFYFHTGIIDPWFNLFIFLGIYQFVLYSNDYPSVSTQKLFNKRIVLSAFFIALAVLTKGPVALLVFGLCFLFWRFRNRKVAMSWKHFFLFGCVAISIPGIWFLSLVIQGKGNLVLEFILYQARLFSTEDAGHGGSFFYHWYILLIGCFPVSIFAIRALLKKSGDTPFELHMLKWMRILFWIVLILFSIVKTKIIHYSSLCYFPLTYLGAYTIYKLYAEVFVWKKWMTILLSLIGIAFTSALLIFPFIEHFKSSLIASGSINDQFAVGNLGATANWNGWEWISGLILGIGITLFFVLKKNFEKAIPILFASVLISTTLAAILIAPRAEEYSQNAAIEFWKEHVSTPTSPCYVESVGYKSYAQYFYANVQPGIGQNPIYLKWKKENEKNLTDPKSTQSENEVRMEKEWMLKGDVDRTVYCVCKNIYENEMKKNYPLLKKIGEKNGFVFWERVNPNFIFHF
jgi:4-amino-4-deoxy-L-arabinose transferase-like glycosyltransferase